MKKDESVNTIYGAGMIEALDDSDKHPKRDRKYIVRLSQFARMKQGQLVALNEYEITRLTRNKSYRLDA